MTAELIKHLPYFATGKIVKGFGRGSKELGIQTANFAQDVVDSLPVDVVTGVYYGWANVDNGDVHKMVMSIGWNPFYNNSVKSMEVHIMHKFDRDLYDSTMKIIILNYIRPERSFNSLEELKSEINNDIAIAARDLNSNEYQSFKTNSFFS